MSQRLHPEPIDVMPDPAPADFNDRFGAVMLLIVFLICAFLACVCDPAPAYAHSVSGGTVARAADASAYGMTIAALAAAWILAFATYLVWLWGARRDCEDPWEEARESDENLIRRAVPVTRDDAAFEAARRRSAYELAHRRGGGR